MAQNGSRAVRVQRAGFAGLAVIEAVVLAFNVYDGHLGNALASALMFGTATVIFLGVIPAMRTRAESLRECRRRELEWHAELRRADREEPLRKSIILPPPVRAPRPAWDVSMTLDARTPWNDVVHYADMSRSPDRIAHGVIRAIPRTAERPLWSLGAPVITSWTVVTRAPSHGEGIDLLKAAGPLLRRHLLEHRGPGARYFRYGAGVLAEVPDGSGPCDAEAGEKLAVPAPAAQPDSGAIVLDPRWEWRLVRGLGVPDRWVKVRCLHAEVIPVESVGGEVVAQLCTTCDTQFPAPRED